MVVFTHLEYKMAIKQLLSTMLMIIPLQQLNEISVIQQSAGQNGVAAKFPGLLGFGAFGVRPGAASPLDRPPSLEGGDERQAAMRELAERGRELAERSRQLRDRDDDQYRSPPAHAPLAPPPAQPSPPAPHHPHPHPLASLPPPARTEGLTV